MCSFTIEKCIARLDCALNIEYSYDNVIGMIGKHIIVYIWGHFTQVALEIESLEFGL